MPKTLTQLADLYRQMADERMERVLETILGAESGVLYFCAAGKDRTGVVSALLLKRLGFDDKLILEDYMASKENLMDLVPACLRMHPDAEAEVFIPQWELMEQFLKEF